MTFLHILLISIVQGLTEFLPISSSGHLVLVPLVTGMKDQGLTMDLATHIGTLLAVLTYYRRDLWQMAVALLRWRSPAHADSRRLAIYIALATIPAVVFGYIVHKAVPGGIRDVRVIAATTIVFGALLGLADRLGAREKDVKGMTLKSAMLIGFAQVLAFIPGTSRSGITMTAARALGYKRVDAARFSFLLSIPATAGAGLLAVLDAMKSADAELGHDMLIAIGCTFLAGLFAISFMMRWLKTFGMMPFVYYRMALGACLVAYIFTRGAA